MRTPVAAETSVPTVASLVFPVVAMGGAFHESSVPGSIDPREPTVKEFKRQVNDVNGKVTLYTSAETGEAMASYKGVTFPYEKFADFVNFGVFANNNLKRGVCKELDAQLLCNATDPKNVPALVGAKTFHFRQMPDLLLSAAKILSTGPILEKDGKFLLSEGAGETANHHYTEGGVVGDFVNILSSLSEEQLLTLFSAKPELAVHFPSIQASLAGLRLTNKMAAEIDVQEEAERVMAAIPEKQQDIIDSKVENVLNSSKLNNALEEMKTFFVMYKLRVEMFQKLGITPQLIPEKRRSTAFNQTNAFTPFRAGVTTSYDAKCRDAAARLYFSLHKSDANSRINEYKRAAFTSSASAAAVDAILALRELEVAQPEEQGNNAIVAEYGGVTQHFKGLRDSALEKFVKDVRTNFRKLWETNSCAAVLGA